MNQLVFALQFSFKNETVEDLVKANKSVKKMQAEQVPINFKKIGETTEAKLVCFVDATFGNSKGNETKGGLIGFLVGKKPRTFCFILLPSFIVVG